MARKFKRRRLRSRLCKPRTYMAVIPSPGLLRLNRQLYEIFNVRITHPRRDDNVLYYDITFPFGLLYLSSDNIHIDNKPLENE